MNIKKIIKEEIGDFDWAKDITTERTIREWLKISEKEREEIFGIYRGMSSDEEPIVKLMGSTYLDANKDVKVVLDNYFKIVVFNKNVIRLMILDIPGNKPNWWSHFGTSTFGIDGSIESDLDLVMTIPFNREDLNESNDFGWAMGVGETSNLVPFESAIGSEYQIFWEDDSWMGPVLNGWYDIKSGDIFKLSSIEVYDDGIVTQFIGKSGEERFKFSIPLDYEHGDVNWRPDKYGISVERV